MNVLDYDGLKHYDTKIKQYTNTEVEALLKQIDDLEAENASLNEQIVLLTNQITEMDENMIRI